MPVIGTRGVFSQCSSVTDGGGLLVVQCLLTGEWCVASLVPFPG